MSKGLYFKLNSMFYYKLIYPPSLNTLFVSFSVNLNSDALCISRAVWVDH